MKIIFSVLILSANLFYSQGQNLSTVHALEEKKQIDIIDYLVCPEGQLILKFDGTITIVELIPLQGNSSSLVLEEEHPKQLSFDCEGDVHLISANYDYEIQTKDELAILRKEVAYAFNQKMKPCSLEQLFNQEVFLYQNASEGELLILANTKEAKVDTIFLSALFSDDYGSSNEQSRVTYGQGSSNSSRDHTNKRKPVHRGTIVRTDADGNQTTDFEPNYDENAMQIDRTQSPLSSEKRIGYSGSVSGSELFILTDMIVVVNLNLKKMATFTFEGELINSMNLKIDRPLFWIEGSDQLMVDPATKKLYLLSYCSKGYLWYTIDLELATGKFIARERENQIKSLWKVYDGVIFYCLNNDGKQSIEIIDI
ncbi:MAG: hypothetical protein ACI837_002639 [Crocinitomicaceae bacterium]|jgi:hypothetical protein